MPIQTKMGLLKQLKDLGKISYLVMAYLQIK